jgi:transposase
LGGLPWTPPSPEAYTLKVLITRSDAITADLVRERNRAEKAAATRTPEAVIYSINDGIAFLEGQLASIRKIIRKHINEHENLKQDMLLLTSIPAIGDKVGSAMLALFHCYSFESAEQLAAYLGLVPTERQSGTSLVGKPHLAKHGPKHLRSLLYMAAMCAIRKNGNPLCRAVYERLLKKGKAKKAALGAVMRKLAHICFGVFTNKTPFNASTLPMTAPSNSAH